MAVHNGLQEVVLLFDADGTRIDRDLSYDDFQSLVAEQGGLYERSGDKAPAGKVRAAYGVVGAGLALRGIAFFQCQVDEEGRLDANFNLPLRYLVRHAGLGPELDMPAYRLACRSQCPVPWHAVHLWEPEGEGDAHPAKLVQQAVWRGRLKLKPVPHEELTEDDLELTPSAAAAAAVVQVEPAAASVLAETSAGSAPAEPAAAPAQILRDGRAPAHILSDPARVRAAGSRGVRTGPVVSASVEFSATQAVAAAALRAERFRQGQRLSETSGEEGRQHMGLLAREHTEQLAELARKYRAELDEQQKSYLEQIRSCRDEIQKLKAALRNEQDRNRRLQVLLRGDV